MHVCASRKLAKTEFVDVVSYNMCVTPTVADFVPVIVSHASFIQCDQDNHMIQDSKVLLNVHFSYIRSS
uniref:AlNc14C384G11242 protein n=1 Tax=Albugo laibachii Nc14 TaxID=890382 RepID=F0WYI0_9STRA|nr:AlNc14C384G11242 [Albugo laibachii Nc14]|eukprot:CCA26537.1 AlNc14C384G11242 [Albugo laibachii Nc14]